MIIKVITMDYVKFIDV